MKNRPLPVGYDDFRTIIENRFYYVDKTLLIKDLMDLKGQVNLFTRPRRFGKTLNLSMLQYFFENTDNDVTNDRNRQLFEGTDIMREGEPYIAHMSKYPVINLTLKSGKQPTFELAMISLKRQIANEFRRHEKIKEDLGNLRPRYERIMCEEADDSDYIDALAFLSQCLQTVYQTSCIILIDEYDVPLENAYFAGFYDQMAGFIRSLFESALKTNRHLEFAVITGCLRITKESIFTGLNNLEMISILDEYYGEYFGFTRLEVDEMLRYYDRSAAGEIIRQWYDGYLFGTKEVFNPWSVIKYVKALTLNEEAFPSPFWANTSSNNIVRALIEQADISAKSEIEQLLSGGTIEKQVHEEITYADIFQSADNLWNFLFFTGYLRQVTNRMEGENRYITMSIPNIEVRYIYNNTIMGWFRDEIKTRNLSAMYQAMMNGDAVGFQKDLSRLLMDSISFMDGQEAFYHGFLLGILGNMSDYLVRSNREGGNGRFDIVVRSLDVTVPAVILELKVSNSFKGMDAAADMAIRQIEEKRYDNWLPAEGYTQVLHFGIAFFKKQCLVKVVKKIF